MHSLWRATNHPSPPAFAVTERSFGSFSRSIPVSPGLKESEIQAKMEDGLLKIEFPKKAEESPVKKIEIA